MRGTLGNQAAAVKQYQKSDKKRKRELKDIKKQKNMLFITDK